MSENDKPFVCHIAGCGQVGTSVHQSMEGVLREKHIWELGGRRVLTLGVGTRSPR